MTTKPKFLRHRVLVTSEALLLISLVKDVINNQVRRADLANGVKVVFIMAVTIGVLSVLFLMLERFTTSSVAKTHAVAQALPVRVPMLALHALALAGLFYVYAWHHGLPVWPMAGAR